MVILSDLPIIYALFRVVSYNDPRLTGLMSSIDHKTEDHNCKVGAEINLSNIICACIYIYMYIHTIYICGISTVYILYTVYIQLHLDMNMHTVYTNKVYDRQSKAALSSHRN